MTVPAPTARSCRCSSSGPDGPACAGGPAARCPSDRRVVGPWRDYRARAAAKESVMPSWAARTSSSPRSAPRLRGLFQQLVDPCVVVRRVVVEEREPAGTGLGRNLDGVVHRAVAPIRAGGELEVVELGVMDQHVDAAAQLQHGGIDLGRSAPWLLVVAEVGDGRAVRGDAVTGRGPEVGNGRSHDLVPLDPDVDGPSSTSWKAMSPGRPSISTGKYGGARNAPNRGSRGLPRPASGRRCRAASRDRGRGRRTECPARGPSAGG